MGKTWWFELSARRLWQTCAAWSVVALVGAASPANAVRTIVIDATRTEVLGDASAGDVVPLEFPVNYGDGTQTSVTVNLATPNYTPPNSITFTGAYVSSTVGLSFTGSPTDMLFADLSYPVPSNAIPEFASVVFLSNSLTSSVPLAAVADASAFDFALMDISQSGAAGLPFNVASYGPSYGTAFFQFTDLSGSGNPGDFGLRLSCGGQCLDIGFNLDGVSFSSLAGPNALPSQFVSYDASNSWYFVFRNAAAVPEPSTWALMLIGFGLLGGAMRRRRQASLQLS